MSATSLTPLDPARADNAGLARRALHGAMLIIGSKFMLQGFTWASTLLVIRLLEPGDYGLLAAAMFIIGLGQLISDGGLARALIQKPVLEAEDTAVAFTASAAVSITLYMLVWIAAVPLANHFEDPQLVLLMRVMALSLIIPIFDFVPHAMLERSLRYGTLAAAYTASSFAQALLTLVFAWLGWGVWALGGGILGGRVVYAVWVNVASPWKPGFALPGASGHTILGFGVTIAATNLLWFVNHSADTAVILLMLGKVPLGLYSIAMQLAMIPLEKVNVAINSVSFSTFSRLHDEPERLRRWFLKLLTLRMLLACPVLIGLALVADDVLPLLLGEKWRALVGLFQILAPVGAIMMASTAFTPLFNAIGRPDIALKYTAVSAATMSLAFYIGCSYAGLVGVCVAWAVSYPLVFTGMLLTTSRASGVTAAGALTAMMAPVLAAVVMTGAVLAFRSAVPGDDQLLVRLFGSVGIGAIAYAAIIGAVAGRDIWGDITSLSAMLGRHKPDAAVA